MLLVFLLASAVQAFPPATPLVMITVYGDADYTLPHTIVISPEGSNGDVWKAVRRWDGGDQIITSADCPALNGAVQALSTLPAVPINPPQLSVANGAGLPFGPIMLDGFVTTLSFRTTTDDGSMAEIQISGGNAYRLWGHRTVAALIGCWGPLTP